MQERPREDPGNADASVARLIDALGRICRYGAELALLEVRERRRITVQMAGLSAMASVCLLTAWVGFNAAAVAFAHAELGLALWAVLLGATLFNAACAGFLWWRVRYRWQLLGRSPLQALVSRDSRGSS